MKAIVCEEYGDLDRLVLRDLPDPEAGPGEVLVEIKAAGVNFPDALIVLGQYQAKFGVPFVAGTEFAGIVRAVGAGVDHVAPGDRVLGTCPQCGAYAELVAVPAENVYRLPDGMTFAAGANLLCAHGTAHYALKQLADLKPGETLLVLGAAGGTGSAAVQIGKAMGARVIAAASSEDKLELARRCGADDCIDYSRTSLRDGLKAITGGGVDVVYDPVGGDLFDACTRLMNRHGRLLVVGFASGRIPSFPVNLALVKEYSVVGVFWGSFTRHERRTFLENLDELNRWYRDGVVSVEIEEEVPLARTAEALRRVVDRKVKGKLVVVGG